MNKTEAKKEAIKELARRELYKRAEIFRKNFKEFVLHFFKTELNREFVWNWHHQMIFEALEDLHNNPKQELLVINIHPNSGKTEIVTKLYSVWKMGNIQDYWVMAIGYSADLTKDFSTEAREYVNSNTYNQIFRIELDENQRAKEYWKTNKEGRYYAVGTGGTITGKRADLIVIDDPINPKESTSVTQLKKVVDWYKRTVRSRRRVKFKDDGGESQRGKIVIIMQRLHEYDLCGVIFDEEQDKFKDGSYKSLVIPSIAKENEQYREIGDAMFPQFFPVSFLEAERDAMAVNGDIHHFSSQYQQSPMDLANAHFKREYFQYLSPEEMESVRFVGGAIGVDPASSESDSSDYRAITVIGVDSSNVYYVRDCVYGRWAPSEFQNKLFEIQAAYGYPVFVETNHGGGFLISNIESKQKLDQQYFKVEGIVNSGNKVERIVNTLQPLYQYNRVFHAEHLKRSELEDQLEFFPKAKHDDLPDSLEIAVKNISANRAKPRSNVSDYIRI